MEGRLKIGELARRAGVTAKAIRFYERRGLLPDPAQPGRLELATAEAGAGMTTHRSARGSRAR